MSHWTYVNGVVNVSCIAHTNPQTRYIIETVLEHLPVVSGSEGNMQIYLVQSNGCGMSSSYNEFGEPIENFNCADEYGMYNTFPDYNLLLEGSLRDRTFEETFKEFNKWINRLAKRLLVNDVLVRISDDKNKFVFDNSSNYSSMFENFSKRKNGNNNPAWTDYLYWECEENTGYPKLLYKKLFKKNK